MNLRGSKTLLLVAIVSSALFNADCSTNKSILSHAELTHLLANARTPQDHLKIAAHFRAEAEVFEAYARRHEELPTYYRDERWQIRGRVTTAHCERIAMAARDSAGEARTLAAIHEDLAKELTSESKTSR